MLIKVETNEGNFFINSKLVALIAFRVDTTYSIYYADSDDENCEEFEEIKNYDEMVRQLLSDPSFIYIEDTKDRVGKWIINVNCITTIEIDKDLIYITLIGDENPLTLSVSELKNFDSADALLKTIKDKLEMGIFVDHL